MAQSRNSLDPQRLVEAAEASLRAALESAEGLCGPWPYPLDLLGSPTQPECLSTFTRWEIQQACEFLVRLGIIPSPYPRKAA